MCRDTQEAGETGSTACWLVLPPALRPQQSDVGPGPGGGYREGAVAGRGLLSWAGQS